MNKLIIKNLNFSYGKKEALKNISLEMDNGLFALLGPNGAGKSTLMKVISTLIKTDNKSLEFNGIPYSNLAGIRKEIGYLPQNFECYDEVTGREFLEFIFDIKGLKIDRKKHINEVIEMVDLKDFADKKVKTYSGGVKRRLGIGQTLIGDAKLIIVDEPTVGLDPIQRNKFRNILSRISKNRTIIISTHIVEDIEFFSKTLFIMDAGEIIYRGSTDDMLQKYKEYVWIDTVSEEVFNKLSNEDKILNFKIENKKYVIKYISERKMFETSKQATITLEDAYICSIKGVSYE